MPDTDLEIRGGGHPEGGPVSKKKFFWPFGPEFGLKIRAGGGVAGAPGPLPGSATATSDNQISMIFQRQITVFKD